MDECLSDQTVSGSPCEGLVISPRATEEAPQLTGSSPHCKHQALKRFITAGMGKAAGGSRRSGPRWRLTEEKDNNLHDCNASSSSFHLNCPCIIIWSVVMIWCQRGVKQWLNSCQSILKSFNCWNLWSHGTIDGSGFASETVRRPNVKLRNKRWRCHNIQRWLLKLHKCGVTFIRGKSRKTGEWLDHRIVSFLLRGEWSQPL